VKLKLDENLDPRVAALFAAGGHDVATVRDEGLSGATDEKLYRVAISEERTLVTLDLDFSNPLRFPASLTPGIIVVRVQRPLLSLIESTVTWVLPRLKEGVVRGRLWIVEPGRVREYAAEEED